MWLFLLACSGECPPTDTGAAVDTNDDIAQNEEEADTPEATFQCAEGQLPGIQPVVISTTPYAGAADVDPDLNEITVTFSEAMTDLSWAWVQSAQGEYPTTLSDPYYATPCTNGIRVALEPETTYQIWFNFGEFSSFVDTEGLSAVPYMLTFRTGAAR